MWCLKLNLFLSLSCLIAICTAKSLDQSFDIKFKKYNKFLEKNVEFNDLFVSLSNLKKNNNNHKQLSFKFLYDEPDYNFTPEQMAKFRGFELEKHYVITEDCYILTLHRIINPLKKNQSLKPVLIQHGLVGSSQDSLMNTIGCTLQDNDERNLGFALAKQNYDVWLNNNRGNTFSLNHTKINKFDSKFWKFTFDNYALQDLPAAIGYIQNKTNCDDIAFIGYSQGTLSMFELLSLRPEISKAIRPYIAIAPVAYVGYDSKQLNITRLPVYFSNIPAGTSNLNIVHFGQNIRKKTLNMLNYYNKSKNFECYGSKTPPYINLTRIESPYLHLFYSENDWLADPNDVAILKSLLNKQIDFKEYKMPLKNWNHLDFFFADNVDKYVVKQIYQILKETPPLCNVPENQKLRLPIYKKETCKIPNSDCHIVL